jgi:hypothetical protein
MLMGALTGVFHGVWEGGICRALNASGKIPGGYQWAVMARYLIFRTRLETCHSGGGGALFCLFAVNTDDRAAGPAARKKSAKRTSAKQRPETGTPEKKRALCLPRCSLGK